MAAIALGIRMGCLRPLRGGGGLQHSPTPPPSALYHISKLLSTHKTCRVELLAIIFFSVLFFNTSNIAARVFGSLWISCLCFLTFCIQGSLFSTEYMGLQAPRFGYIRA